MDNFIRHVKDIPDRIKQQAKMLVEDTSKQIVIDAVNNIRANGSTNYGALMQSVTALPYNGGLGQEIYEGVEYAAAIEFGTKANVNVQPELQSYAAQFKGIPSGGTWEQFLAAILDWVKKKGITGVYSVKTRKRLTSKKYNNDAEDERVAFLIARSIYKKGVQAKPHFFPAWFKNTADFDKKLEDMLKEAIQL